MGGAVVLGAAIILSHALICVSSERSNTCVTCVPCVMQVAIKLMERGSKITKYVERELINHSHLLHPHIVQVWGLSSCGAECFVVAELICPDPLHPQCMQIACMPNGSAVSWPSLVSMSAP